MKNIANYPVNKILESDLVYPLDKGYHYVAKLDSEWVKSRLRRNGYSDIGNKYCVTINNNGFDILVTNHDGTYYFTTKL